MFPDHILCLWNDNINETVIRCDKQTLNLSARLRHFEGHDQDSWKLYRPFTNRKVNIDTTKISRFL